MNEDTDRKSDDEAVVIAQGALAPKSLTIDFRFDDLGLKLKGSGISVLNGVTGEIKWVPLGLDWTILVFCFCVNRSYSCEGGMCHDLIALAVLLQARSCDSCDGSKRRWQEHILDNTGWQSIVWCHHRQDFHQRSRRSPVHLQITRWLCASGGAPVFEVSVIFVLSNASLLHVGDLC